MALLTTTSGVSSITPDDIGELFVRPTMDASVFASLATIITTNSHRYRIPLVTGDASAAWTAEGAEIAPSDSSISELIVVPSKLAVLSVLSAELADDSDPAAAEIIGESMGRDLARKLDSAMFGGLASPAPAGLSTLSGVTPYVSASAYGSLDFAAEAVSAAESVGASLTHFVTSPSVALRLAKLRTGTGSNEPLLGRDATAPTGRSVLGIPIVVSEFVQTDVLWGIDSTRVYLVVRSDASVEADRSVYFTSDRVALRGTLRCAPGFVHPASVVRISLV